MYQVQAIIQELKKDMSESRDHFISNKQLILRELRNESKQAFFLAIEPLEEKRMLIIPITKHMGRLNLKYFPICKGTKVERVHFDKIGPLYDQKCLVVVQTNSDDRLFEAFIVSVLEDLWSISADKVFLAAQKCMQKWQDFFSKITNNGLSSEEQRGLFGELYYLRNFLQHGCNPNIVTTWQGPYREYIDYLVGSVGVEVKTTLSEQPLKVTISSEKQLSLDDVSQLFLAVLPLQVVKNSGESLLELIQELRVIFQGWPDYLRLFEEALLESRYHDSQADKYVERYKVRGKHYFLIDDSFPKITSDMLPRSIINVRYEILLDSLDERRIDEAAILEFIQGM